MKKKKSKLRNIKVVQEQEPREPIQLNAIEKTLLGMLGISILATLLAFILQQEIISYVLLANYLFLGFMTLTKPVTFIEMMRKNRQTYDEHYEKKEKYVLLSLRVAGIVLLGIGIYFGYQLFFI